MYNRYIPNGTAFTRISEEDGPPFQPPRHHGPPPRGDSPPAPEAPHHASNPLEGVTSFLSGLFKSLDLGDIDTGDILLLLIILFLFLEGDNLELVITLGLLLLFGLGDKKKEEED